MLRLWIVFNDSLNSGAVAVRRFMYVHTYVPVVFLAGHTYIYKAI